MEQVDNRMVADWQWPETPKEIEEKPNSEGYTELHTGIFVAEEDAYAYALERVSQDESLQKELVEWFYSGNWVRRNDGTD